MRIWDKFSNLFEELASGGEASADSMQKSLEQAAAVLLFEMSRADFDVSGDERKALVQGVQSAFELDDQETAELVDLAEHKSEHAVSLHQYTSLINDHWDLAEKESLMLELWQVAYADGVLDKYEEHYARKVSDLLYLPHASYIRSKLDALEALGLDPDTR